MLIITELLDQADELLINDCEGLLTELDTDHVLSLKHAA